MISPRRSLQLGAAACLSCALMVSGIPDTPAHASGRDFLTGVGVGVGGTLLYQHMKKNQRKQRATTRGGQGGSAQGSRPASTIASFPTTREQTRDYQTRLNTLGFDAGTPDGIAGRRTAAAVRAFQVSIGAAATGVLSQLDATTLVQQSDQAYGGSTYSGSAAATGFAAAGNMQSDFRPVTGSDRAAANAFTFDPPETTPAVSAGTQIASFPAPGADSGAGNAAQAADFDILGVSPGMTLSAARTLLEGEGFADCNWSDGRMLCQSASDSLTDRVVLSAATNDPDATVYLVARHMNFADPIGTGLLLERMSGSYQPILDARGRILASEDCQISVRTAVDSDMVIDTRLASDSGELDALARACPSYAGVRLDTDQTGAKVDNVMITLFSGDMLLRTLPATATINSELDSKLKF